MGQKVTATIRGEVFSVCIRGWMKGQYVSTDLPRVGAEAYRVAPQTGVQIHFIKEGLFVNFKTSSSYAQAQAISLLVIEYPRTVDMHNFGKFERFKANIPITFFYEEGNKKYEDSGIVRDISSGGALISHGSQVTKKTCYMSLQRFLLAGASIYKRRMSKT